MTTCNYVSEQKTETYPVTTCNYVSEQKTEMETVTNVRMVNETATRQVPVAVPEQVQVTLNRCVPRVVSRQVPVQQCVHGPGGGPHLASPRPRIKPRPPHRAARQALSNDASRRRARPSSRLDGPLTRVNGPGRSVAPGPFLCLHPRCDPTHRRLASERRRSNLSAISCR